MAQQHVKEYVITAPKGQTMQHNIMRFHGGLNIDFDKWPDLGVKMERENNMREFKTFGEEQPKFGAGSEFGREAREEARRKKYGIHQRKYKPDDQPWMMKVGTGKTTKKYKGTREGGITENASYYIFTPGKNNSFEAYPIKEWYNFMPIQRYKALTEEEAEEQFIRRDRTLNYFAVMVGKKVKGDTGEKTEEEAEGKKGKGKQRTLKFDDSDFEESEGGSEGEMEDKDGSDNEAKSKAKQKSKKGGKKPKKKKGTDSEAEEDSGDGDQEGAEVDYMSSEGDSDSDIEQKVREELKGVGDETGLKQLLTSDEESEEEKKKSDQEEEDEDEEKEAGKPEKGKKEKKKKKKGKKDEESSYSSTTDSEDEEQQQKKKEKKAAGKAAVSKIKDEIKAEPESARPSTPKPEESRKRPLEGSGFTPPSKLPKTEPGLGTPGSSGAQFAEGLNDETLRRYLARKPMTAVDLLALFKRKKTGLSTDQLVAAITDMLKRINPIKNKHQGKTYFSLRK